MHKESIMQPICDRELHEECGVFGVVGVPDAANLTYYGLHSLQHRGQEGCGIVSVSKEGAMRRVRRCSTKPSWQTLRAIWPSVMSVIRRPVAAGRRIYSLFCSIITRVISHWPTTGISSMRICCATTWRTRAVFSSPLRTAKCSPILSKRRYATTTGPVSIRSSRRSICSKERSRFW